VVKWQALEAIGSDPKRSLATILAEQGTKGKFMLNALKHFADANGKDLHEVTAEELAASEGGMEKWQYMGMDTSSRGPLAQQLRGDLKKPENADKAEVYKYLSPELQKRFRLGYCATKSWKFLEETKSEET
jgi:hypothetical protein